MPKLTDKAVTPVELLEAAYRQLEFEQEHFSLLSNTRRQTRRKIGWIQETGGRWRRRSARKEYFSLTAIPSWFSPKLKINRPKC